MNIVEEIRQDREKGASRLQSEYKVGLLALARRFCSDESDAEELVNRTFAEVVANIDGYLEQSAFFGWMSRILINLRNKDVRRKENGMVNCVADLPDDAPDDEACNRMFNEVDSGILRDAIEGLPNDMKNAIVMHYFMDMSIKDITRVLLVPEGTVKWRLHCARQALTAKLGAAAKSPTARKVLAIGIAALVFSLVGFAAVVAIKDAIGKEETATMSVASLPSTDSQLENIQGETDMNNRQKTAVAVAAATLAAVPTATASRTVSDSTERSAQVVATAGINSGMNSVASPEVHIAVSNGFTLDTRPSPQLANAPIEQFSTMSPGLIITVK